MPTHINIGEFRVGCTDRIRATIKKDGTAWSGIDSVTLTFNRPDGTTFQRSMTLESGNIWYYDTLTTDIDQEGVWTLDVRSVDVNLVKRYEYEIGFMVKS